MPTWLPVCALQRPSHYGDLWDREKVNMEKGLEIGFFQKGKSLWEHLKSITFLKKGEGINHKPLFLEWELRALKTQKFKNQNKVEPPQKFPKKWA